MKDRPLSEWWVSEWHPDGSIKATPLVDVIQRNGAGFLEGKSPGFVLLGINPTMEGALDHNRQMKRMRRQGHEESPGSAEA